MKDKYVIQTAMQNFYRNTVAAVLKIVAVVVIVVGIIVRIVSGNAEAEITGEFGVATMISTWLSFFVYGVVLLGIGEIIDLLQKILDQSRVMHVKELNQDEKK